MTLVARHAAMVNYLTSNVSLERAYKMVEGEEQYFEEQEANAAVMRDPDDMSEQEYQEREPRVEETYREEQAANPAMMLDPDDVSEQEYQEREPRVDGPEPRELPPPREPRRYQPPPTRPPPKGAW